MISVFSVANLLLIFVFAGGASAQTWPTKPLRVVVPFTAASATDTTARIVAERLTVQLGQTLVVENRPGAGGTIGVGVVAKAEPDGYTILVHSSSFTVTPTTYPNTPYNTLRDFSGITPLANLPNVLVIAPSRNLRSVKELVAAAKAKPGTMTYASAGAGSATQLNAERFRLGAGFEGVHVPFKGTPEALTEILTGRVDYLFLPGDFGAAVHQGRQAARARRRQQQTLLGAARRADHARSRHSELGLQLLGRHDGAGENAARQSSTKLYQNAFKALQTPDMKERMAKIGAEPMLMTPQEFDAYIRKEIDINAALVKAAGITVN